MVWSPLSMAAERPKVIYVMGSGRSGSSILGVALGNCDGIFYAGELAKWLWRMGAPFPGSGAESESFWQGVRERVDVPPELAGANGVRASHLERTSSLLKPQYWPDRRRLRRSYVKVAQDLFGAVASQSNSSCVVDTSHHPLRALALQRAEGIDLYLIYLVRDAQGVVASADPSDRTSYSKTALSTNGHLSLTHVLSLLGFWKQPGERRMFLRHEDFLADPEGVMRQILQRAGFPDEPPDMDALTIGSPLMGNRFLKKGPRVVGVRRAPSPAGRRSWMTSILQAPWEPIFARLRPAVTAAPERFVSP
jgi:Sulfotransferase family